MTRKGRQAQLIAILRQEIADCKATIKEQDIALVVKDEQMDAAFREEARRAAQHDPDPLTRRLVLELQRPAAPR